MFDADTVALISEAPALDGLDLAALPQRLTEAYAGIVAARIRLRRAAGKPLDLPVVTALTIAEMRRLAYSLEALISVLPDRPDRASAGFVAGTAHHVRLLAERLTRSAPRPLRLTADSIPSEVSATLLFLIAESVADAAEMSKAIRHEARNPVEAAVLDAVGWLATGRLGQILRTSVPPTGSFVGPNRPTQAVRALYYLILQGIRGMAATMLGLDSSAYTEPFSGDFRAIFRQVRTLSAEQLDGTLGRSEFAASNVFPGPAHMASLLLAVSQDLPRAAVAGLPPPKGIDLPRWQGLMRTIASRRPYLWRNHRQAIDAGYLERGVSAVVSFPTGAGKSTLAELKIAASLLRSEKVVFLAPTLALVDQTARALGETFPNAGVQKERSEEALLDANTGEYHAISVMTPERCLTLLGFSPEFFAGVGLLVFDECHLLHPRELSESRRAVDAMLCVLNFAAVVPDADLMFLSAMMSNATSIASWIQNLTQRSALALELTWKPTRQVRGCVVYPADQVEGLQQELRRARSDTVNRSVPAAVGRRLVVQPFGFFCLRQTWSDHRSDYALLPLLDERVQLSTGTARDGSWYLTPNGNQVAASIAAASAAQGLKTLTFTQTIPWANAAVRRINEQSNPLELEMTEEETKYFRASCEEVGSPEHLYLETSETGRVRSSAAVHHGLLLPTERHLHESLFRRANGINALVATSTLAQGMNLPSEVVLIAGDSRFDPGANRVEQLEAHELLNAAGRAGRAGEGSHGFVLVVPSKVVHFDNATSRIARHWADLQAIFSKSDQCMSIEDPLVPLLDQIHSAAGPLSSTATYLLRRLPIAARHEGEDRDAPTRDLLNRSLGAFLARTRNDEEWIASRTNAVLALRRTDSEASQLLSWVERLSAAAGVSMNVVLDIVDRLRRHPVPEVASVVDWREAVFDWLEERPELVPELLRREVLEGLLGASYRQFAHDHERGEMALPLLRRLCREWMAGSSLEAIELAFGTPRESLGKCETAREFALRAVPELAYLCGLFSQVARALAEEEDSSAAKQGVLERDALSTCVREGFDRVEKLALKVARRDGLSRVGVHREFDSIAPAIQRDANRDDFRTLLRLVRRVAVNAGSTS